MKKDYRMFSRVLPEEPLNPEEIARIMGVLEDAEQECKKHRKSVDGCSPPTGSGGSRPLSSFYRRGEIDLL
jgi:hypothetical protein